MKEATITLEAKALDNLLWRIEYRGDFSDQDVFKNDDGDFKDHQHSIGIEHAVLVQLQRRNSGTG